MKETQGENAKPFTKIGFVEFPSDIYLSDLRVKLKESIPELRRRKTFLFQDAMMADVEPVAEETTKSMYNLSVIINFASHKGIIEFFASFSFNILAMFEMARIECYLFFLLFFLCLSCRDLIRKHYRELNATFLSHGRQPEVNILQARTNVSPRFSK